MLDAATTAALAFHNPMPDPPGHIGCYCNSTRSGWIVATTHAQAETWANTNLQRRGYRTYLPLVLRHRRDRAMPTLVHHVLAPLWPGYLFVHHDTRDSWRPIYETPGVRSVLKAHDQIQFAPEAAVSALQAGEQLRRSMTPETSQWAPGMPCSLRKGYAFEDLPAVVLSVHDNQALVSLMFLGHLREITVATDTLEPRDDF